MARTAATVTQADVARVIRAARQAGAGEVVVMPDGTMVVRMTAATHPSSQVAIEDERPVVL